MYQVAKYFTKRLERVNCLSLIRKRGKMESQFARQRNDAQLLFNLITELACFEKEERSVKVTASDLRDQMQQENPPFECAIAESDGKPAGFALYFYAYSTWEGKQTLYLEDLYVSARFRGTGLVRS